MPRRPGGKVERAAWARWPMGVLLACTLLATSHGAANSQDLGYSLMLGGGRTSWSGPFVAGGRWGAPLAAFAAELGLPGPIAIRTELGFASTGADMGTTGMFAEETTLSHYRAQLALAGRAYLPARESNIRFFAELGLIGWVRTGCDVDMVGGPGFLGGETRDCSDWEPDGSGLMATLDPARSGLTMQAGIGVRRGAWGAVIRHEAAGTFIDTDRGPMKSSVLFLAVEWVFHGHDRKASE